MQIFPSLSDRMTTTVNYILLLFYLFHLCRSHCITPFSIFISCFNFIVAVYLRVQSTYYVLCESVYCSVQARITRDDDDCSTRFYHVLTYLHTIHTKIGKQMCRLTRRMLLTHSGLC